MEGRLFKRVRDKIKEMNEKTKEIEEGYVDALGKHLRLLGLDATKVVFLRNWSNAMNPGVQREF